MNSIKEVLKRDLPIIAIILISIIVGAVLYPSLPERVPSHWNINGEIDGYSSRFFGAFGLPLMCLGLYFLLLVIPFIDPKRANYSKFEGSYMLLKYLIIIFMLGIYIITLLAALGYSLNIDIIVKLAASLLFLVIGNMMSRFRHNYFCGIRTPWTLASEEVWTKTHRMGAVIWVIGSIILVITSFIRGSGAAILFFAIIMIMAFVPIIYSYIIYKNIQKLK